MRRAAIVRDLQVHGHRVAFVGDGINDEPALATADVGVAMGLTGTDLAWETAQIALLGDELSGLPHLLGLSRRAMRGIRQNLAFSLGVLAIAVGLTIVGILRPVSGALLHELSSIPVIGNSARLIAVQSREPAGRGAHNYEPLAFSGRVVIGSRSCDPPDGLPRTTITMVACSRRPDPERRDVMGSASVSVPRASRWARIKGSMTPGEWRRAGGMAAVIAGLHVVGFGILILVVAPHKYGLGASGTFAIATGVTAYTLGLRHAFDADHISAIDNTTRKFMSDGKRPLSVGFFFSLGHSTIVFALAFLIGVGIKTLDNPVKNDKSTLHKTTGLIGTGVSGIFLYIVAILNIIILISIVKIFFAMRRGKYNEQELERELNSRGLMNRLFGKRLNKIKEPWQMYPVGVLFGLGFDTATEVALLVIAGSAGAAGLPFYAIICLPILFAAGMCLLDTIDGSFMNFAYGWAFSKPVRKVYYNITITGLSVAVALFIGTIELVGLLTDKLGLRGSVADWFQNFDINKAGFIIVGMFVVTWVIALAVWRVGRIEEKWMAGMEAAATPEDLALLEGMRPRN